jgi:hypothetical protein
MKIPNLSLEYYGDRFEWTLETIQSCMSAATQLQKVIIIFFNAY